MNGFPSYEEELIRPAVTLEPYRPSLPPWTKKEFDREANTSFSYSWIEPRACKIEPHRTRNPKPRKRRCKQPMQCIPLSHKHTSTLRVLFRRRINSTMWKKGNRVLQGRRRKRNPWFQVRGSNENNRFEVKKKRRDFVCCLFVLIN